MMVSLPKIEVHEKTYPVNQVAVFSQTVNPSIAQMIAELVADGITKVVDVKCHFIEFSSISSEQASSILPNKYDRWCSSYTGRKIM